MTFNHKLLNEILDKGFDIKIEHGQIFLGGFYKSGNVELVVKDNDTLWVNGRYDTSEEITTFDELVMINYNWWLKSRTRSEGWMQPNPSWAEHMVRLNLIKPINMVIYTPASQDDYELKTQWEYNVRRSSFY